MEHVHAPNRHANSTLLWVRHQVHVGLPPSAVVSTRIREMRSRIKQQAHYAMRQVRRLTASKVYMMASELDPR